MGKRPDPRPLRIALGLSGVAAASAMASTMLDPARMPAPSDGTTVDVSIPVAEPDVIRIRRFVQLPPSAVPPPGAVVQAAPQPTPRVVVVTTTRQSGTAP